MIYAYSTLRYMSGAPTQSSHMVGNKRQSGLTTSGSSLHNHGSGIHSLIFYDSYMQLGQLTVIHSVTEKKRTTVFCTQL